MTNCHDFPTQFPPDPRGGGLRWTIAVLIPTVLALSVLNTRAIVDWAQELPPSPGTAKVLTAADAWHAAITELGLDAPRSELHEAWKRAETTRWPEARPAESVDN